MAKRMRLKILVVDDNEEFCQNLKDLLELVGHDTACVTDGYAAVNHVKAAAPDFILLDSKMEGKDGLTTMREVKQIAPEVRVIMISAYTSDATISQAMKEGAIASLGKPVDFPRLLSLIDVNRTAI